MGQSSSSQEENVALRVKVKSEIGKSSFTSAIEKQNLKLIGNCKLVTTCVADARSQMRALSPLVNVFFIAIIL